MRSLHVHSVSSSIRFQSPECVFTFVVVLLAVHALRSSVLRAGRRAVAFRRRLAECVWTRTICGDRDDKHQLQSTDLITSKVSSAKKKKKRKTPKQTILCSNDVVFWEI